MISVFLYLSIPIICYLYSFIKSNYKENIKLLLYKYISSIILFIVILFFCGSYVTGVDWFQYEKAYHNIRYGGYVPISFEPLYLLLTYCCSKLNIDFWTFLITTKIFIFFSLLILIKNFSSNSFFIISYLMMSYYGVFLEPVIRNLIALALFWLSFVIWEKHNKKIAIFLFALSSFFHISMIFVFLFLIYAYVLNKLNIKYRIILFFITYLLLSNFDLFRFLANDVTDFLGFKARGIGYILGEKYHGKFFSITNFASLFIFMVAWSKRKVLNLYIKNSDHVLLLSGIYILASRLTATIPVFSRMAYAFLPFYVNVLYCVITKVFFPRNVVGRFCFLSIIIAFNSIFAFQLVTHTHKYIPYTNYFYYKIIEIDMPLSIREDYTRKNYPFNKNK